MAKNKTHRYAELAAYEGNITNPKTNVETNIGPHFKDKAVEKILREDEDQLKDYTSRLIGVDSAKEDAASFSPKYKKGGSVSSASKRADGCAVRGKTKGRMV